MESNDDVSAIQKLALDTRYTETDQGQENHNPHKYLLDVRQTFIQMQTFHNTSLNSISDLGWTLS